MTNEILAAIGLLTFIAALFFVVRLGEKMFTRWHHFYIGLVLSWTPWWPVQVIGIAISADDAYQHWRQKKEPEYLSPLHNAYVWVYRKVARIS